MIFGQLTARDFFFDLGQIKRKITVANNMYKPWLILAYLENPADFPMLRECLQLSVTNHATAHTRNVGNNSRSQLKTQRIWSI
ncbi:hypothetical protein BXY82_3138 [Gelidibacter sediminis]|uniref:Uncharacterized protein n=1 Tax=Gelidibacter sediminis TaxID=1608710 RepID=A0A4R7PHA9_9FLAO|nr:hypothetical protein BXY82_3138 [Gelidibacter sediminis]